MYIVNTSTSIVPIPTRGISGNTIVYVSSSADQGQLVTIFDIDGFLSSPNSILVSSSADTNFGPGISSIQLQQRYSYVTLRSENAGQWSITDESAFPLQNQSYTTQGIQFTTLAAKNVVTLNSLVASDLQTSTLTIQSSACIMGALFTSSIVVNNYPAYLNGTNYPYFQANSASNAGDLFTQSTISTGRQGIFQSSFSTMGPIFIQNNMSVSGTVVCYSTLNIQNFLSVSQRVLVNSNVSARSLVARSNIICFKNAQTSSFVAYQTQANIVQASGVLFSTGSLQTAVANSVLQIQPSLYISGNTSILYTSSINAVNTTTRSLTVGSTITASNISTLYIPNAVISNPHGSLIVSSFVAGNLQAEKFYGKNYNSVVDSIVTQNSQFSSLYIQGNFNSSTITTPSIITDTCVASSISCRYIDVAGSNILQINNLIGSLHISSAFFGNQMSSFTTFSTLFDAAGATLTTAALNTTGSIITSSLELHQGITATNSLFLSTGSITLSTANIQAASTLTTVTSSLYTIGAAVGVPLTYVAGSPYIVGSTLSGLSTDTNSEFITGQGTPYFPFRVVASYDRTVNGLIQNPSALSTYLNLSYSYRTDGNDYPGSTSIIFGNPIVQSTIATFSSSTAAPYQKFAMSNYYIDTNLFSTVNNYYLTGPVTYAVTPQTIVLAGGSEYFLLYSSDAGSTWTTLPFVPFETSCQGIAWGLDKWVAVGNGTSATISYSYTGTVWYSAGKAVFTVQGNAVSRSSELWLSVGTGTNSLAYSYDGVSWTGLGTAIFSVGLGLATSGTAWVAVGQGSNTIAYSPDGVNWTGQGTSVFSVAGRGVQWNGSLWVAVGQGTYNLATSVDGVVWTRQVVF